MATGEMGTDERATDEGVRLPVLGERGARSIQLPEGWLDSAEVHARRVGGRIVLEPVHPAAHPSWPAGFGDWVDGQRELLDLGEIEPFDIRLQDANPHDA